MGRPRYKRCPSLTYLTNDGSRLLITLEPAKDKILRILYFSSREDLSIREIGELTLPDAYNVAVCLEFIRRVINHLKKARLVVGKKKPQHQSAQSKRTIWKWRISIGGRRKMQHLLTQEAANNDEKGRGR